MRNKKKKTVTLIPLRADSFSKKEIKWINHALP